MDRKTYNIGLLGKEKLICEGADIYCYTTYHNKDVMLMCDKNEKIMKMKTFLLKFSYLYCIKHKKD